MTVDIDVAEKILDKAVESGTKIKRLPLTEQVYQEIKEGIVSGRWRPGDKLPSENELAEIFGVNRLTVRGALQKLNILGIVETRVGEGTYVLNFNLRKYVREVAEFAMQPEKENEIRDFRKLLEIECAKLAMERGTEEELAELKKLADECRGIGLKLNSSYQDGSFDKDTYVEYVNTDLNFHFQICKMSHNSLYLNCFNLARELINRYILLILEKHYKKFIEDGGTVEEYFQILEHDDIYNAIKEKDFERCRKIYLRMIDPRES